MRSVICLRASWALEALLLLSAQLWLCQRAGGRGMPVSWAVKLSNQDMTSSQEMEARARELAKERGLEFVGRVEPFPNIFQFDLPREVIDYHIQSREIGQLDAQSVEDSFHNELSGHPSVMWASKQVALKRTKRVFSDPAFEQQWHLVNRLERGHDTNVSGVWKEGVNGRGVTVAVVDDGVERTNPDLVMNYNAEGSHDFNSNDKDPSPNLKAHYDNSHGTKCAGLIAAGANEVCGVGVAYGAQVAGIRMLDGTVTDILEGKSFIHKAHVNWIYSCSWGPEDDGKTVEGPGYVAREAMELAIEKGRYGYGNVFVFASGNGGVNDDNCNYDGYANSIYTITIGAVDEKNGMPYYAELCSAMLAVTYSNGHSHGDRMVVTTDASSHHGCTHSFSGTSAAAPIASGMIALMLQARNCLTWRDVQSILVYTAVKVDASHAQWAENGAMFNHSNQHGFGLLDAYRMTRVAGLWPLLPTAVSWSSGSVKVSQSISPHSHAILTRNVTVDELPNNLLTLEHVTVTLSLSHSCRGLLSVFLVSPHGTNSTLTTPRKQDKSSNGLKHWTFSTVKFWAESPVGLWTLVMAQSRTQCAGLSHDQAEGTVNEWTLSLHGSAVDPAGVQQRRRLVEEAVATPTWTPLLCPALPSHPRELHLSDLEIPSFPLWKKILLVIGCVLIGVLAVHCMTECVWEKVKLYRRQQVSLPSVKYTRLHSNQGNVEEEGGGVSIESGLDPIPALLPMDTDIFPRPHIGRSLLGNATRLFHQITSPQTVTVTTPPPTPTASASESELKADHLTESCELTELSGEAVVLGEISREMLSGGGWGVTPQLPGEEAVSTRREWEREREDEDVETAVDQSEEQQQPLLT